MAKKTIRPLGDVLLDMEPLLQEMTDAHGLQWGDTLQLVYNYLMVHCPEAREQYTVGGHPEFYYGPKKGDEQ
jgi:hypothetical protein